MKDDTIVLIAIASIAAVAIIAAFFGGFVFGNRGQGIIFSRDDKGRIESIMQLPSMFK
jgi:hypothetical protein